MRGIEAALCADGLWQGGDYKTLPLAGLKAISIIWAGWALCPAYFQEIDVESTLADWEKEYIKKDPNDLLAMGRTWQSANVGKTPGVSGGLKGALRSIKARTLLMPSTTDMYFLSSENGKELKFLQSSTRRDIDSQSGHMAGSGHHDTNAGELISDTLKEWLARNH